MKMLSPIPIDDIDIDSFFIPVIPLGNETVTSSSMMMNQEEEEGLALLGEGSATGRDYPFLPSTTMDLELNTNNTPLSHEATEMEMEIAFTHFTKGTGFGFTEQQQGFSSSTSIGDFSFSSLLSPSSSILEPNSDDHVMLFSPSTNTSVVVVNEEEIDPVHHGMQLEATSSQRVPIQEGNANGVMEPEEGRTSRRKQKLVCKVVGSSVEQSPTKKVKNNKKKPRQLLHELTITHDMPAKLRNQIANAKKNYNRREAEKIKLVNTQTKLAEALALIKRLKEENHMLRKRLNKYEKKANGRNLTSQNS